VEKAIAALLTALATAAAALASSGFERLAPSVRREQVLLFESKRLALIEMLLRIRSQYASNESTKNDIDKVLDPLLKSSLQSLKDTSNTKGTNALLFV
jgi:type VI protein secretion system component VasK